MRKVIIEKDNSRYAQCVACLSTEDIHVIYGEGLSTRTSLCKHCINKLCGEVSEEVSEGVKKPKRN